MGTQRSEGGPRGAAHQPRVSARPRPGRLRSQEGGIAGRHSQETAVAFDSSLQRLLLHTAQPPVERCLDDHRIPTGYRPPMTYQLAVQKNRVDEDNRYSSGRIGAEGPQEDIPALAV